VRVPLRRRGAPPPPGLARGADAVARVIAVAIIHIKCTT
jgi:hypothetical protein